MTLTPGKHWGIRRLADADGFFRMTALDQRPPIMNLVKKRRGTETAPDSDVSAVKRVIARELAPHSTAVLVDPLWGYEHVIDLCSPGQGLILTLEDHRFEEFAGGRKSRSIADWSVEKIRRIGGDAVKVLAWFRPDAEPSIIEHQKAYVRSVGEACRRFDIPFVFELLVYPFADASHDYQEDINKHSDHVLESVRIFADECYGVDIFKLESPWPTDWLPEPGGTEAQEAQRAFDELGRLAGRPWVMLSAGASADRFKRVLQYAYRAGASGFLAGRAIWWESFQCFPDLDAMASVLKSGGSNYMRDLQTLTASAATPWYEHQPHRAAHVAVTSCDLPSRYKAMN